MSHGKASIAKDLVELSQLGRVDTVHPPSGSATKTRPAAASSPTTRTTAIESATATATATTTTLTEKGTCNNLNDISAQRRNSSGLVHVPGVVPVQQMQSTRCPAVIPKTVSKVILNARSKACLHCGKAGARVGEPERSDIYVMHRWDSRD